MATPNDPGVRYDERGIEQGRVPAKRISFSQVEALLNSTPQDNEEVKAPKVRGMIEFGQTKGKVDNFNLSVDLDDVTVDHVNWKEPKPGQMPRGTITLAAEFPSGIELPLKHEDGRVTYHRVIPATQYGTDRYITFTIEAKPLRVENGPEQAEQPA